MADIIKNFFSKISSTEEVREPQLSDFFPDAKERLENYQKFRKMFQGKHRELFSKEITKRLSTTDLNYANYVICNFAKLVSLTAADYLFGERHEYRAVGTSKQKEELERIIKQNKFHLLCYRTALGTSYRGDGYFKIRFSNGKTLIESIKADIVFPEFSDDNVLEPKSYTIAWIKKSNGKYYLRREIHRKGLIENTCHLIDNDKLIRVPLENLYEDPPDDTKEIPFDDFLVVHIPNWQVDEDFFGFSDYYDIDTLIDELNNRYSQVADILDKHADPKLSVPESVFQTLLDEYGRAKKEDLGIIGVPDDATNKPEYIVWDAQLEHCFREIDYVLKALMLYTETSPDLFGLEGKGPESGRALRFRLMRTIAKVRRKAIFFDPAIKKTLEVAQKVNTEFGSGSGVFPVEIIWKDGIPVDMKEQTEIEAVRTGGRPTSSLISAIKRLDDVSTKEAKEEIRRMNEELSSRSRAAGITPPDER